MPVNNQLLQDIKAYAENFYLEYNYSPSVREIADALGCGKSTVQRYLERLRDMGDISYEGRRGITTDVTDKVNTAGVNVGLVGSISCGALTFAEQNITDYFRLPASLVGSGEFFMLKADGDSMIDAGIDSGDLVIIKKQPTARVGEIVVALNGEDTTLKRLARDNEGRYFLHPENERYSDIYVDELIVQGVAVKVIKDLV